MKIYINTDLEGICSFVDWEEASIQNGRGLGYTKHFLTAEVNAAIEGILSEDPSAEIIVQDGHCGGYWGPNLIAEELHPRASLIQGKRGVEIAGLDRSIDLMMAIGVHSMAGTRHGVMNHTISHNQIMNFWINDVKVGELGIWAAIAGYYGIPVGMLSGDYWAVEEAKALLGNIEGASVKKGINQFTAECLSPEKGRELIKEAARSCIANCKANGIAESTGHKKGAPLYEPYIVKAPIEVKIEYTATIYADKSEVQGAERLDGRTVLFTGDDLIAVMNQV